MVCTEYVYDRRHHIRDREKGSFHCKTPHPYKSEFNVKHCIQNWKERESERLTSQGTIYRRLDRAMRNRGENIQSKVETSLSLSTKQTAPIIEKSTAASCPSVATTPQHNRSMTKNYHLPTDPVASLLPNSS